MISKSKSPLLLGLILGLAGCGTAANSPLLNSLRNVTTAQPEPASLEAQQRAVERELRLSEDENPALMVVLAKTNSVAALVEGGRNGDVITWFDASGVSLSTRNGVVVSTRGLSTDLMAANVTGTLAAMKGKPGSYQRVYRYLDGEYQLGRTPMDCSADLSRTQFSETCRTADGLEVTNTYSISAGKVTTSRQWLGDALGYATLTRFR